MRSLFVSLLLLIGFTTFSQAKKVRIKMVQYLPYCDKANTTKDVKNTPTRSVVYANKKLIVVSADHIDTITTDKTGYIKVSWSYGTYLVFEPWKYYKQIPKGFSSQQLDMACLQKEWLKEDLKIVVSKKTTTVANNIILLTCPSEYPCLTAKNTQSRQ
jgi:hypothetical protein